MIALKLYFTSMYILCIIFTFCFSLYPNDGFSTSTSINPCSIFRVAPYCIP